MNCDLHIHSNLSDGWKSIAELIEIAKDSGLKIISITDHNSFEAYKRIIEDSELKIIKGVEISACHKDIYYHFVMYNFNIDNKYLLEYEQRVRQHDIANFIKMIEQLKTKYGLFISQKNIDKFLQNNIYFDRVRLNNLFVEANIIDNPSEAFYKYTKNIRDKWAHQISLEELFELEKNPNSIISLAHPTKYFESMAEVEKAILYLKDSYHLRAIEAINSRASIEELEQLVAIAKKHNLLISGGSDYHAKIGAEEQKKIGYANGEIYLEDVTILKRFDI